MSDFLWKLKGIRKDGITQPRLSDITFEIVPGITAVIGASGAGKSSLLDLLVDFEKPDDGELTVGDFQASHAMNVYWVPQNGGLWPQLKVEEHLTAVSGKISQEKVMEILSMFRIEEKLDMYPGSLSMGERARLSIARALAADAAVLVMDEPLMNIDPVYKNVCWKGIVDYVRKNDVSLVFSSHNPRHVIGSADRVVCLREGQAVYSGNVDELYMHPQTCELAECLGETNWFTPEDARLWLNEEMEHARSCRPECLDVIKDEASDIIVCSADFQGEVTELELKHDKGGCTRNFWSRIRSDFLKPGDRIVLRFLGILIIAFWLMGCSKNGSASLSFEKVKTWRMPCEGRMVPEPRCITTGPNNDVYVIDSLCRVLVFNSDGQVKKQWLMPDRELGRPEGIWCMHDGRIAVADTHYNRVVIFNPDGTVSKIFGEYGAGDGQFGNPVGITQDDKGNLYVCEYGVSDRVQKFTADGKHLLSFGHNGVKDGEFQRPAGIVWYDGKLYVADAVNNRIQVFSDNGNFIRVLGVDQDKFPDFYLPYDVKIGPEKSVCVIEYGNSRITRLTLDGKVIGCFGEVGYKKGQFSTPWGIAVDDKGGIYVADTGNRRIVTLK